MKNILMKVMLFIGLSSLALVGCSTNTQNQNTAIGAVSGAALGGLAGSLVGSGAGQVAAIAGGAIVGGLLGGYIGHNMDSSDNAKMNTAMTNNPAHKSTSWKNKKTGAKYSIAPTSNMMAYQGHQQCRKFHTTVISNNDKRSHIHGVACLQSDGTWQTVTPRS